MRTLIVSAAILGAIAAYQPANAQTTPPAGDKPFCIEMGQPQSKMECRFDTMAQCEESAKQNTGAKCAANPAKK